MPSSDAFLDAEKGEIITSVQKRLHKTELFSRLKDGSQRRSGISNLHFKDIGVFICRAINKSESLTHGPWPPTGEKKIYREQTILFWPSEIPDCHEMGSQGRGVSYIHFPSFLTSEGPTMLRIKTRKAFFFHFIAAAMTTPEKGFFPGRIMIT